ncbi:hypothetical protein O181_022765 [Austropuccinia psidii MF-1]|uniref:Uncharacterized protein n=1 Tax=Austropuccinia psidii MF-1 TaxID=1389203 RepID=A0A9Q3CH89_9BASI|nr:hypothetical protein [Austropuccinia psidii MF-1]
MKGGGPKLMVMAWGPRTPLRDKRTPPGPKTKTEAWGLGIWKLARKANDGRIWPESINDYWGHERAGEGAMDKGGQLAIKDMVLPIGPNLVPGWISPTPMKEGHYLWL